MSTITKDHAQKIIEAADEVITALAGTNEDVHPESDNMLHLWDDLNDRYAPPEVVRELARIALASLEAEPVAFVMADDLKDSSIISTPAYRDLGEAMERTVGDVVALYAIHPAPASLDAGDRLSNFIASQESLSGDFEKVLAENIEGLYVPGNSAHPAPASVLDAATAIRACMEEFPESVHDIVEECAAIAENACRAAMHQGTEPVSNRDELPDGWVACSERMPETYVNVLLTDEHDDVCIGQMEFEGDIYFYVAGYPNRYKATHWMPLPAAPQQEVK